MTLSSISPRSEPVLWSTVVAAAIAAAASYGLNVTDEMTYFLVLLVPFVIGSVVARFNVLAPDTVEAKILHKPAGTVIPTKEETYAAPPTTEVVM